MVPDKELKAYPKYFGVEVDNFGTLIIGITGLNLHIRVPETKGESSITITINGDEGETQHTINFNDITRGIDFEKKIRMTNSENQVTITVRGEKGEVLYTKEFTAKGDGYTYTTGSITFTLEGDEAAHFYSKQQLDELAKIINTVNSFLRKEPKITRVFSFWTKELHGEAAKREDESGKTKNYSELVVSSGLFKHDEKFVQSAFWHESSHVFTREIQRADEEWKYFFKLFEEVKQAKQDKDWNLYNTFNSTNTSRYPRLRHKLGLIAEQDNSTITLFRHVYNIMTDENARRFFERSSGLARNVARVVDDALKGKNSWFSFAILYEKLEPDFKDNAIWIFDESSYNPKITPNWGHPESSPEELFASATAVLINYSDGFMRSLSRFKGETRETVLNVAKYVVNKYLQNANCPKDLFDHRLLDVLGIEKKPMKLR